MHNWKNVSLIMIRIKKIMYDVELENSRDCIFGVHPEQIQSFLQERPLAARGTFSMDF